MDINELYEKASAKITEKKLDEAKELVAEMKKMAPNFKGTHFLDSIISFNTRKYAETVEKLEKILPHYDLSVPAQKEVAVISLQMLGESYTVLGVAENAVKYLRVAAQMTTDDDQGFRLFSKAILAANCIENFSDTDFQVLYAGLNKYMAKIEAYPKKFYDHEKIRVGFLSVGFGNHVVMHWSGALLTKLDKNLFEPYYYADVDKPDKFTDFLRKNLDNWRDISKLTDEETAKIIHDDEIDILFDLDGYFSDHRLRVSAYRPASVQIAGIGYINSTGLECFDYFLSDEICAGDEDFFTEKIIKLPQSHICYNPLFIIEVPPTPPCLKNNFVTFGSFNNSIKITDSMLVTWKKILDAVPQSRLILKHIVFGNDDGKKFFNERLKSFGFDLDRVEMRPFSNNWIIEYADVDIALDTFPYTGGVTTCEALYMGVPVISLYGSRHGTRFGLSILKNIRLDGFATTSYEGYFNLAVALANDWELLKILRKNLRPMMEKSPLMDSQNYVHEMQNVFVKILNEQKNS